MQRFLDIGTGLPIADNTHEVAQRSAPDSRIVYVDFDRSALRHAQALLTSTPVGRTEDSLSATWTRIPNTGGNQPYLVLPDDKGAEGSLPRRMPQE
jgi:S-adenosyl methyltransferase